MSEANVLVVDWNRQFVGFIHAATARQVLKAGAATVLRKSPFTIRLPIGETRLPTFVVERKKHMHTQLQTGAINWIELFAQEKDLWVQNTSAMQHSMQFEIAQGVMYNALIPVGSDPICLTHEVPFEAVKRSMDFRRFVNSRPVILRLLSDDQVVGYYAERARAMQAYTADGKPDVAQAIVAAEAARKASRTAQQDAAVQTDSNGQVLFSPPRTVQELGGMPDPSGAMAPVPQAMGAPQGFANAPAWMKSSEVESVMAEAVIHPRVVQLCADVSPMLPANTRKRADVLLHELRPFEGALRVEDLEYVRSNGGYPSVRKWAEQAIERRMASADASETPLTPDIAPPMPAPSLQAPQTRPSAPRVPPGGPGGVDFGGI